VQIKGSALQSLQEKNPAPTRIATETVIFFCSSYKPRKIFIPTVSEYLSATTKMKIMLRNPYCIISGLVLDRANFHVLNLKLKPVSQT
jgi:hypothetical protein